MRYEVTRYLTETVIVEADTPEAAFEAARDTPPEEWYVHEQDHDWEAEVTP